MSARRAGSIVLVGHGKMAAAFARAMRQKRVSFTQRAGRSARGVARRTGSTLWLLAVTDAAVPSVCESLARSAFARGDSVVHFAGMLGPEALDSARAAGCAVGAWHPLVAVASKRTPTPLEGLATTFEGDPRCERAVRALARAIGISVHRVRVRDRARYHAAAALVATGTVALAQGAAALWARTGESIDARTAGDLAASLARSAAHNIGKEGADRALASPLLRGETRTVERHLSAMAIDPHARELYRAALSVVIERLARERLVPRPVIVQARDAVRQVKLAVRRPR